MKTISLVLLFLFSMSISDCDKSPCFEDRNVTEELNNVQLFSSVNGELTLLKDLDESTSYSVCNANAFEIKDSTSYVVSGLVYEVKPNERWPGIPFEITKIKN